MKQQIKDAMRNDIPLFAQKIRAYEAGEIEKKAFKGFSGGFGSYPQRSGGYMLRLRMAGGRLTKERLKYLAESAGDYGIDRMKLTTCQTVQLHNLSAQAVVELMEKAVDADIITRGGGGDFPRNVMASPLSGVERGEYFDVLPWAEAAGEYLLTLVRDVKLPRKLKVGFSGSPENLTHVTFRDLGFAARSDGKFDVYCAGGLGPAPRLGVLVAEGIEPAGCAACIDAMIAVFTAFGNYENRARSRTRYLQDTLGADGLKAEYAGALEKALQTSPKLSASQCDILKTGDGEISGERVIPQKQTGLYAVSYHPPGGNLPPSKPRELYEAIKDMPYVEGRISPDGSIYFINLTAAEAKALLDATCDSAVTPFEHSVSCIGGTICSTGIRDSQGLLNEMLKAVEAAKLPANALPTVHVSGCGSSCGAHQSALLGFQGSGKVVDGQSLPAFMLLIGGKARQGEEKLGTPVGTMLQSDIPAFMVELGKTVARSGMDFESWLSKNDAAFRELAGRYV